MSMYYMKKVNNLNEVLLPQCMYRVKNLTERVEDGEISIDISNKVKKFFEAPNHKMTELVQRQDDLLKKLDFLYDRIKTISINCKVEIGHDEVVKSTKSISPPDENVLILSPDNLPWYLNILLRDFKLGLNIKWHIHSSVPNEKVGKVTAFVEKLQSVKSSTKVNLRLIFKCVAADSELKLSTLAVPIVGNVNIMRYLSYAYPGVIPYDHNDYFVDYLLDICHLLERSVEKNRDALVNKLFAKCKKWIYGNEFTIVDLAAYNIIKQWRSSHKDVPIDWFYQCNEKLCF